MNAEPLVDALAYALARADLPSMTETSRDYASRLAPLVIGSGYLDARHLRGGLRALDAPRREDEAERRRLIAIGVEGGRRDMRARIEAVLAEHESSPGMARYGGDALLS